ncbi:uncharacterized protein LY89DRAFT_154016 [Mollisia scopiformis]|uniref:Uncharacterized protein n=1 Tax=Mollisia scopiformis TaxID=149040 RepID=A0A194WZ09_MOLSC|nr:uncharacterized protein LY89DRAFT_154016 [Mollisia scopiformis]KUJ13191.1 hypothetical protein LY89DRAFT_154016 [Mollisia scopiformis]
MLVSLLHIGLLSHLCSNFGETGITLFGWPRDAGSFPIGRYPRLVMIHNSIPAMSTPKALLWNMLDMVKYASKCSLHNFQCLLKAISCLQSTFDYYHGSITGCSNWIQLLHLRHSYAKILQKAKSDMWAPGLNLVSLCHTLWLSNA